MTVTDELKKYSLVALVVVIAYQVIGIILAAQDPHPPRVAAAVARGALARLRERGPRHVVPAEARLEERREQLRVLGVEGGELYGVVAALVADEAAAVRRPEGRDGGAHLGRRQRGKNHHEEVELLRRVRELHGGRRRR